jgi:tetratricopeptide (TPR) repeat protein
MIQVHDQRLSILNMEIDNNINLECIKKLYPQSFNILISDLIDTGMINKKEEQEGIYQFSYHHIQNVLAQDDESYHKWAIEYYKYKPEIKKEDKVEILFHKILSGTKGPLINDFLKLTEELEPTDYGFKRLIDVGEQIRSRFSSGSKLKAELLLKLGYIYGSLYRIDNSEECTREALSIYKKLLFRNKKSEYFLKNAIGLAFIGNIYSNIGKFEEAEKAYNDSLNNYYLLSRTNKGTNKDILANIARVHLNKGLLFSRAKKYEESAKEFEKTIHLYDSLDKKSSKNQLIIVHAYIGIGRLLIDSGKTEEGMSTLKSIYNQVTLSPGLKSSCLFGLARGFENQQSPREAAKYYLLAAANEFILFEKGSSVLQNIVNYLDKAINLGNGDGTIKCDAELLISAINKLQGKHIVIPQRAIFKQF